MGLPIDLVYDPMFVPQLIWPLAKPLNQQKNPGTPHKHLETWEDTNMRRRIYLVRLRGSTSSFVYIPM
jgi:hypothetical protein